MKIQNIEQIQFVVFCVEALAEKCQTPSNKVFNFLYENNIVSEYIVPNFDVLHTQGKTYIVNDLLDTIKERGLKIC